MFRQRDLTRVRIGFCGMDLATGPVPTTPGLRSSRSSPRDQPVPHAPIRLLRFPRSTPPPVPSARPLGFSVRSQRDSLGFNPQTINGSRSYPRRREVQSRRAVGSIAKFRKKDMRRGSGEAGSGGQQMGSGRQRRASRGAAAGRRRGRDDGLAPSFFTRYPPHDCLEGRGVVSGAYAANVSGFRMRGADHAGPREKLSATRSLSAPSERQRLSAAETLVRHPGVSHAGYFALVLVSWRPGVLSNRYPMQLHWRVVGHSMYKGCSTVN